MNTNTIEITSASIAPVSMKKMTSADFHEAIDIDPAWASKLTEPVEITEFCNVQCHGITHLSPLLHFTGVNERGLAAVFLELEDLEIAEGTFYGAVIFQACNKLKKINPNGLIITKPAHNGVAADFNNSPIEIAEGRFAGAVDFSFCNLKTIGDLEVSPNKEGTTARLRIWDLVEENLSKTPLKSLKSLAQGTIEGNLQAAILKELNRREAHSFLKSASIRNEQKLAGIV